MIRTAFLAFFGFLVGSAWAQSALYSNGPSAVPLAQLDKSSPNNLTTGPRANSSGPCVGCGQGGGGGGGCTQATTLNAALDGGQNSSAVTTLICGLVTDGTYSLFYTLYMFATNSTANALVNWANPGTSNATSHGTMTFTANVGYTGDGSTGYLDTNFLQASLGVNSTSLGECDLTANTSTGSEAQMGIAQTAGTYIILNGGSGGTISVKLNQSAAAEVPTISSTQGEYVASRTNSSGFTFQLNGGTAQNFTVGSAALSNNNLYIFARENGSLNTAENFTSDQLAYAFIGQGLTTAQVLSSYQRFNTYLNTVGSAGPC